MTSSASRVGAVQVGKCPVGGLEVEDDHIGKVLAMFILAAVD
jgi:hypothetical protein